MQGWAGVQPLWQHHMVRCSGSLHGNEAVVCVSKCLFVGDPVILPHELVSLECIANASMGA